MAYSYPPDKLALDEIGSKLNSTKERKTLVAGDVGATRSWARGARSLRAVDAAP